MFLKFYSKFLFLRKNFNYLPRDLQVELVEQLESYCDMCKISKVLLKKGVTL